MTDREATGDRLLLRVRGVGRGCGRPAVVAAMLYLLENREVREVFFPSGASEVALETACAADDRRSARDR